VRVCCLTAPAKQQIFLESAAVTDLCTQAPQVYEQRMLLYGQHPFQLVNQVGIYTGEQHTTLLAQYKLSVYDLLISLYSW
jgi:hypothetical protein